MSSFLPRQATRTTHSLLGCNCLIFSRCSTARLLSSSTTIQENEIVLLNYTGKSRSTTAILTKPLSASTLIKTHKGQIKGSDIIGKRVRDIVASSDKERLKFRIHRPTLAQYTDLSPRLVTPIYSQDANLIISLLDLNPTKPSLRQVARSRLNSNALRDMEKLLPKETESDEKLEIFEAGTGHGALTLYLARAIHAANPPAPPTPAFPRGYSRAGQNGITENHFSLDRDEGPLDRKSEEGGTLDEVIVENKPVSLLGRSWRKITTLFYGKPTHSRPASNSQYHGLGELAPAIEALRLRQEQDYARYLSHRRAVIQTLDISPSHSNHARNTICDFRNGIYYPSIDFHVGTIPDYLSGRLATTNGDSFLSHAILDLPRTHVYLDIIAKSLKPDGILITWNPSLTQIIQCVTEVRHQRLPFILEQVLEVGKGAGVGGREWDVRAVLPRDIEKKRREAAAAASLAESANYDGEVKDAAMIANTDKTEQDDEGMEMICRPKVGIRTEGGGFIGVWRRIE
ncbi:S-adenosyl-L-methionine-dependent methyltransferase [Calycina marina]|uniref:tRNA (adenine(58)-N(1))-methyltransferase catalytic subunit TRM61 n=1 Tax=Calycina marina TaxID=1763456 RepID=A0A9P7Z9W3_9HELO|nr:S-adenosyl-L-methionine-dependent methyltransferase [Calycina marina]